MGYKQWKSRRLTSREKVNIKKYIKSLDVWRKNRKKNRKKKKQIAALTDPAVIGLMAADPEGLFLNLLVSII